jgi:hypothetical protein
MRRRISVGALLVLLGAAAPATAAVFAWREAGTLHFSNDPAQAPRDGTAHRFEARQDVGSAAAARPTAAVGMAPVQTWAPPRPPPAPAQPWTSAEMPCVRQPQQAAPAAAFSPLPAPIVIAPTVIVRLRAPTVRIVELPFVDDGYPLWFVPSGFIGHEHPQVGFLAGQRLIPHSHFFAHGRAGLFTPYGHFTLHGLLREAVPSY